MAMPEQHPGGRVDQEGLINGHPEHRLPNRMSYPYYRAIDQILDALTWSGLESARTDQLPIGSAPAHINADFGIPLFSLAKIQKRSPQDLALEIASQVTIPEYSMVSRMWAAGPFLNVDLDYTTYGTEVVGSVLKLKDLYGAENIGRGQKVIIDMSSPNIAKQMSIGHLRSTIIGDSLARIFDKQGYQVVKDNHIGDWGTQFGKLIYAIKRWGDESKIEIDPISSLQELYVKFHAEAENDPQIEEVGRAWFKKLEDGDPEARQLWRKCVDWSMTEFQKVYDVLGVDFDVVHGESFYEPHLQDTVKKVQESGLLQESKGALGVDLSDQGLGFAIVLKSDGATLYMTREIATGMYRSDHMQAEQMVYVVGEDQKLYFEQFFAILKRLGYPVAEKSRHVYFGMVTLPEGRMSTRKGRVVLLKDVIAESINRAEGELEKSNPSLFADPLTRAKVARQVGVGALKWNDLMNDPKHSIVFDWDKMLSMTGNSAPYVQYSHARAVSIVEKADLPDLDNVSLNPTTPIEREVVQMLATYPLAVRRARETYTPAVISKYLFDLCQKFNKLYEEVPVLKGEPDHKKGRVALVSATAQVIKNGLDLLGIEAPGRM